MQERRRDYPDLVETLKLMHNKVDDYGGRLKNIELVINGNGSPENGLNWRFRKIEDGINVLLQSFNWFWKAFVGAAGIAAFTLLVTIWPNIIDLMKIIINNFS